MTSSESGPPGRAPSRWILGTELSNRIAELYGDAYPPRLLDLVIARLKRSSRNFRLKLPDAPWSVGLEIPNPPWPDGLESMGGPIVIYWQAWKGKILVADWLDGGDGWTGWRKAVEQLGMVDVIVNEDDLRAVHGATFPIEILDEAIQEAVAELRPRLAGEFGTASSALPQEATPAAPVRALPDGAPSLEQFLTNKGDQLPLVKQWARSRYGKDELPNRDQLLLDFRKDYGKVPGVSDPTMRELRKALASEKSKKSGRKPAQKP